MPGVGLTCFGVGDGWPSAERNHSAYLYQFENEACLIDCGEPLSQKYKASGLSYDLVDRIFLSHFHFDHTGSFGMFIQSCWLEGRKKDLWVHGPAHGLPVLRELLKAACIFDEVLPFRLHFEPLQSGSTVAFGGTRVTPFRTRHLAGFEQRFSTRHPGCYDAFCFLIESGGVRLGHSADIGVAEDLRPLIEQPLDLLVCEMDHVPAERILEVLTPRDIGTHCFVHLSRACLARLPQLRELAYKRLGAERVLFARDGETMEIGR